MTNYMRFEKQQIELYKRKFQTRAECENKCVGYLQCMVDMGVMTEDRKTEEYVMMYERIIGAINE